MITLLRKGEFRGSASPPWRGSRPRRTTRSPRGRAAPAARGPRAGRLRHPVPAPPAARARSPGARCRPRRWRRSTPSEGPEALAAGRGAAGHAAAHRGGARRGPGARAAGSSWSSCGTTSSPTPRWRRWRRWPTWWAGSRPARCATSCSARWAIPGCSTAVLAAVPAGSRAAAARGPAAGAAGPGGGGARPAGQRGRRGAPPRPRRSSPRPGCPPTPPPWWRGSAPSTRRWRAPWSRPSAPGRPASRRRRPWRCWITPTRGCRWPRCRRWRRPAARCRCRGCCGSSTRPAEPVRIGAAHVLARSGKAAAFQSVHDGAGRPQGVLHRRGRRARRALARLDPARAAPLFAEWLKPRRGLLKSFSGIEAGRVPPRWPPSPAWPPTRPPRPRRRSRRWPRGPRTTPSGATASRCWRAADREARHG